MNASTFRFSAVPFRRHAIAAIVRRDYQLARSYRLAFGMDLLLGFANLILYFFISRTFTGVGRTAGLHGAPSYFAFALVGIVITVVMTAASTSLAMRIREEQLTGTLEALVVQPLGSFELAVGLVGFPFLFAMVRALAYLGIAWAWLNVDFARADWSGVALVFLSAGLALTSLGIALGAIVLVIKKGDVLASLAVFALGLISGALFPISVLPDWLEPLAKIAPMRFAFDGLRSALYRGSGWGEDVVVLALFGALTFPAAVWIFDRSLRFAERKGSLAQY
jgi:ABC-type multidrug transport system permease subunit